MFPNSKEVAEIKVGRIGNAKVSILFYAMKLIQTAS